jgi:hypothetical protein
MQLLPVVRFVFISCLLAFSNRFPARAGDLLHESFVTPPASARPWVLRYWMDGQIDRHGITRDLESMAR